jgi:glycosyltransferase involved in cell wall biosynthesis
MKCIFILTDNNFWRGGNGSQARTKVLVEFLCRRVGRVVIAIAIDFVKSHSDVALLKRFKGVEIVWLDRVSSGSVDIPGFLRSIDEVKPNAIIFRIRTCFEYRDSLPPGIPTILDVDDVQAEIEYSKSSFLGKKESDLIRYGNNIDREIKKMSSFDYLGLIQQDHLNKFIPHFPAGQLFLLPHSLSVNAQALKRKVKVIGIVSSAWTPNVTGLEWFLKKVWPNLADQKVELRIFGSICNAIKILKGDNVVLKGYVADLDAAYKSIDIFINPVAYGSGVKIKTLEALSYGLPCVVSPEGARGLLGLNKSALLVVETAAGFENAIKGLIESPLKRASLAKQAVTYIKANHDQRYCYSEFDDVLSRLGFHA